VLYARQWADSHGDAEDVVQDAFVRFWRSGRARAEDARAYLFAAVKHSALDHRRGRARRARREDAAHAVRPQAEASFASDLERDEWRERVEAAMAGLPGPQREVLVMKVWGGLTFPQIAAVVGAGPNTVASRYRYALAALRARLAEEECREIAP
jgi:RNA polymerase sigma-70 factor (ECF subfamily)